MQRINVVGTTGSGKSTFTKRLAEKLDYPAIHMDQLFWKANWQGTPDDEFMPKVEQAISGNTWVLDGNYSRTSKMKYQRADTIIWLDYSATRTFFQLLGRSVARITEGKELWEGTGNIETFKKTFMSKDSILIWFFKGYGKNKAKYAAMMNSSSFEGIELIRLRSPKEVNKFLETATP